tara:strand:+ start:92935 stop:94461 length:1527 start_codon:yes stop_codon:yes gene_type:complete
MAETQSIQSKKVFSKLLNTFFYFFTFLNIGANFLGSPMVKYIYLVQLICMALLCVTEEINTMIWPFIIFSLFEGQGRVVWGYHPLFRLIFDILLVLLITRAIIIKRSFFSKEITPNMVRLFFILHLFWFGLELFNPNGAGFLASLATAKFYLFPLLLFFLFLNFPVDIHSDHAQKHIFKFTLILGLLAGVTIVQDMYNEEFMYGISQNYKSLFPSYSRFTGPTFRPWGTTFVPGGMGLFYFLSCGLLLLFNPKRISSYFPKQIFAKAILFIGISVILFSSFIGQVRSATLKLVGVFVFYQLFKFYGSKFKAKWLTSALFILLGVGIFSNSTLQSSLPDELNIERALSRWEGMTESNLTDHRAGLNEILHNLEKRVELPFGYGLGMTQNFLPAFAARRAQYIDRPSWYFWSMDNLYAFLILELGVGALFYIGLIFSLNATLFSMMISLIKKQAYKEFKIVSLSFTMVLIITLFAWGSVSIPFNPVSFFFWFWSALGVSEYFKYRKAVGS